MQDRLRQADMLTLAEAARRVSCSASALLDRAAQERFIILTGPRRLVRLPEWQFREPLQSLLPALTQALAADGWALLSFLETPCGALGGQSPRQALDQHQLQRVLELAWGASH